MFREKIELKDLEKMDAEYRELLGRVVTIQADCEIGGPHLYVKDILPSAPSKVDQLMVARTAAEEMDHFRKIARVGGDMGLMCPSCSPRPIKSAISMPSEGSSRRGRILPFLGF
jgi:hypothetical protein